MKLRRFIPPGPGSGFLLRPWSPLLPQSTLAGGDCGEGCGTLRGVRVFLIDSTVGVKWGPEESCRIFSMGRQTVLET